MNSKYKVLKFSLKNFKDTEDLISIEEPLEISLKYKSRDKWLGFVQKATAHQAQTHVQ